MRNEVETVLLLLAFVCSTNLQTTFKTINLGFAAIRHTY
jgi:hypothetical protein